MQTHILILHKQFEESLENLINGSELPAFVMADILDKATEKLKHIVTIQTMEVIQTKENKSKENVSEN